MTRPTTAELQAQAVRGSLWTSLHATLALPLAVFANVIVARTLGPVQFGYLATLMAAYGIATTVANFGISDATIQWGAGHHVHGADDRLVALVRRCSGYHLVIETPLIVAVTAVILRNASWETQLAACVAAGVGMAIGTGAVVQTLLSRTATLARVAVVTNVALQVAVASAAVSSHSGFTTWAARLAVANVAPMVLLFVLPRTLRSAVLRPVLPTRWPDGFLPYAVKAAVGTLAAMLVFSRSEIFVLQADHLGFAAGVYALAFGLAMQLTAPVDALLGPMLPAAASLAAAAPERLAAALLRGLRFTALAAGGIAAVAIAPASAVIAPIYGTRFHSVSQLLLPLALASCIQSLNHPVTAFMYGMRRVGAMLLINVVAFAVDLAIAIATVPVLHAWGATLAVVTGQLISLAGAAWFLRRELALPVAALAAALRAFPLGVAAAVCGWLTCNVVVPSAVPAAADAALGFLVGGLVFFVLLRVDRPALTPEDVDVLAGGMPDKLRRPATRTLSFLGFAS
jgi:O-antigen/teichoic acid export membrane protein